MTTRTPTVHAEVSLAAEICRTAQPNWSASRRDALLARVREAADALRSHFGARCVVLFGSLLDRERFTVESDVDLAVEGLEPFDRWDAWWLCEEIIQGPVDLLPIECADPSLLQSIQESGVELQSAAHRPSPIVHRPSSAIRRSREPGGVDLQ